MNMNKLIATPLISIAGIAGIVAFGAVSHASVTPVDADRDGYVEGYLIDRWEDGIADVEAYDSNLDGVLDLYAFDQNNDGRHDAIASDPNQNGRLNHFTLDTDFDGQYDLSLTDANENNVPDSQEVVGQVYQRPADQSMNDMMVQHIVTMELLDQLADSYDAL